MTTPPRIALIHATPLSMPPIAAAFERNWPQARRMNLLDDSLSVDRDQDGRLTDAMVQRFVALATYAVSSGCGGILFTCSAFGPAIEAARRAAGVPTLKPNEAMFGEALAKAVPGRTLKVGLAATFPASIPSMSDELRQTAAQRGIPIDLVTVLVPGAMDDLRHGRGADHDRKIAAAAGERLRACDVAMLAQFSMAQAQPGVQAVLPCPVLTSPDCAVQAIRRAVDG